MGCWGWFRSVFTDGAGAAANQRNPDHEDPRSRLRLSRHALRRRHGVRSIPSTSRVGRGFLAQLCHRQRHRPWQPERVSSPRTAPAASRPRRTCARVAAMRSEPSWQTGGVNNRATMNLTAPRGTADGVLVQNASRSNQPTSTCAAGRAACSRAPRPRRAATPSPAPSAGPDGQRRCHAARRTHQLRQRPAPLSRTERTTCTP